MTKVCQAQYSHKLSKSASQASYLVMDAMTRVTLFQESCFD